MNKFKPWNLTQLAEFTEAMCVSGKVIINFSLVNQVSNISFLPSKPLMFW